VRRLRDRVRRHLSRILPAVDVLGSLGHGQTIARTLARRGRQVSDDPRPCAGAESVDEAVVRGSGVRF
jgi:hypothetical protein